MSGQHTSAPGRDAEHDTARQLRLCADALHSARSMVVLSTGLSIVAAIGVALAGLVAGTTAIAFWSATLAIGIFAQWIGFRVAFDARLFARLADEAAAGALDLARFDATMGALGLMPPDKAGRDSDARCRGALDLVRTLGLIAVMQVVFRASPARRCTAAGPDGDADGRQARRRRDRGLRARADGRAHLWAGGAPTAGPRVYYANHASHGDFALIWACLPDDLRERTRPVAGADYWLKGKLRTLRRRARVPRRADRPQSGDAQRGPDQADGRGARGRRLADRVSRRHAQHDRRDAAAVQERHLPSGRTRAPTSSSCRCGSRTCAA